VGSKVTLDYVVAGPGGFPLVDEFACHLTRD
jgi:hypothetical protein